MAQLDHVELLSLLFRPNPMFPAFQTLGNTTNFEAFPAAQGLPVAVAGSGSTNATAIFDNRKTMATSLLLMFAATAANNAFLACDVTGFGKMHNSSIYLPIRYFNGIAQAGNISLATSTGEANSFLCDQFSTKTFAGGNVSYIEPADDIGGAVMIIDIRGVEYVAVRIAKGGATAALKGQVYVGVN